MVDFALIQSNGGCILGKAHDTDMIPAATDENGSGAEGGRFIITTDNSRWLAPFTRVQRGPKNASFFCLLSLELKYFLSTKTLPHF